MNRRKFLVNVSCALGYSVTTQASVAIDAAVFFTGINQSNYKAKFERDIVETIRTIADIVIPATDTPSASHAFTHIYIDFYFHHFLNKPERINFLVGMDKILPANFLALPLAKQTAVIKAIDDTLHTVKESQSYKQLKELIVIGYYTSEVGGTQALNYDPVPGPYKEMKLKDVGRVWL